MKKLLKQIVVWILTIEAILVLKRYKPKIVGVTGSVGKTSTKEAIATILESHFTVRKNQKSFNSEIGVPLTVLGLDNAWGSALGWFTNLLKGLWVVVYSPNYPKWLVVEMGVDHPGDMEHLVRWVPLDVAVMTIVGDLPVHVEFFSSVEAVVKEKSKILWALKPDGVAVLAYDDERVRVLKEKLRTRVCTFGLIPQADIHGDYYNILYSDKGFPWGINFKVIFEGNVVPVTLSGILGRQFMYPLLAAFCVGMSQGLQIVEMTDSLRNLSASPGRMRIIEGVKNTTIIDDTYNSSPIASFEALQTMKMLETHGRKIAVLGDMLELGEYSEEAHKKVGEECGGVIDMLITVGVKSRAIAEIAMIHGVKAVRSFEGASEAGAYLKEILQENDVILVKGSQSIRLERVVEEIMAHPEKKKEFLVRQDEEWARR